MKKILYILMMLTVCVKTSAQNENAYIMAAQDDKYSAIANAYEVLDYYAYIAQDFWKVTTILPTNNALQTFVDPVSYYYINPQMWEFAIDPTKTLSQRISASIYNCTIGDDGIPVPSTDRAATTLTGATHDYVKNRLEFLLNNSIIMEPLRKGKQYYKTRGNSFVRVEDSGNKYKVSGTLFSQPVEAIAKSVDNGVVLTIDAPIVPNYKSVAKVLSEHEEFSDFLWVLENSGALNRINSKDGWLASDQTYGNLLNEKEQGHIGAEDATSKKKSTYLLDGFHYTIYAPTNAAMQQAFAAGLPNLEKLAEAERLDEEEYLTGSVESHADSIREVLLDFVKYHIQDNSIFIDEGFASGRYESGKTELIKSTNVNEETGELTWNGTYSPGRPYKLDVNVSSSGLTVTDHMGNKRSVITTPGMYNIMACEYWNKGTRATAQPYTVNLDNSSFVVIHAIDGPLFYDAPYQFKYEYKKLYQDNSAKQR